MFLVEELKKCLGLQVFIFCSDGGAYPSSGKLVSIDEDAGIAYLEYVGEDLSTKTFVRIKEITRFTAHLQK